MKSIALGFFDGIHLGHQEVIKKIYHYDSYLVTFDISPKIFFKGYTNCLLTTNFEKEKVIRSISPKLKVEFLVFSKIYNFSAEEFIKFLKNLIDFDVISVGYDFRFGKDKSGNISTLRDLSKKYGYDLLVTDPVKYNNKIIHSSLIRYLLINYPRKLDLVKAMLGRYYSLSGIVIEGNKIGRKIGFPTANILVPNYKVIPYWGIYKVNVYILNNRYSGRKYEGLLHVGPRPVINNYQVSVEVWIKDFEDDIYYEPIEIELVSFIRKVKNFRSLNGMVKQIEKDVEFAFRLR